MPTKEYGYRNGQLLVTASNGDEQRLTNYVAQLYYRAGGYDSTGVQIRVNALANAGAQGELPLREAAKTVVRQIYQASGLPAADFVAALYLGALQRYGDPGGLSYWTSIAQNDRNGVIEAFVGSGEFNERAQVLYGREVNEYDRTDKFTHYLYNVIEGRGATATERDARRAATDGASVVGQSSVVTNAKDFARSLFNGAEYAARNRTNSEFVADLYFAFLRYAPDAGGWNYWTGVVNSSGRAGVLETFLNAGPFDVQAGALYREVLWLVPDHLGTPRMIVERTGSAAGIKHHDYLPFGEELFNGISGRDASHGYGAADSARQQFTGYERDGETGLDYAKARYYSSVMGRFTSIDPLRISARRIAPQSWNRYAYVLNNPLKYNDPSGLIAKRGDDDGDEDELPELDPADTVVINAEPAFKGQTEAIKYYLMRTQYPVVMVFYPSTKHFPSGLGGHVAYSFRGYVRSWEQNGWRQGQIPVDQYIAENDYRDMDAFELDFGASGNRDFQRYIESGYDNIDNGIVLPPFRASNPNQGGYNLVQNNCGEAFCRATRSMNLPADTSILPSSHARYINDNLRGNTRQQHRLRATNPSSFDRADRYLHPGAFIGRP